MARRTDTASPDASPPSVRYTAAPGDLRTARWLRDLGRRTGLVVVDATATVDRQPTETDVATAVLAGLGKTRRLNVLKRSPEPVALAWLCALGAQADPDDAAPTVVVLEAQTLGADGADQLLAWCAIAGLACCFVFAGARHPISTSALYVALADRDDAVEIPWRELRAELGLRPETLRGDPLADPQPTGPPWQVPRVDGLVFRSACRRQLTFEDHAAVDAYFMERRGQLLDELQAEGPTTVRHAAKVLRSVIEDAPSTEELITCVRAAQVACVLCDLKMAVDTTVLLAAAETLCRRGLATPQQWWRRLEAYQDPDPGALAALYAAHVHPDAATRLHLGDIQPAADGVVLVTTSDGAEVTVPAEPARFLVAQRLYRLLSGAGEGDPLFDTFRGPGIGGSTAGRMLRRSAVELGIDLIEDKLPGGGRDDITYLARYGITLAKLHKAANGALRQAKDNQQTKDDQQAKDDRAARRAEQAAASRAA